VLGPRPQTADGRLVAVKYGAHADDPWSVDEILSLSRRAA
jgi:hypothetical protein